eukprot:7257680-Karenia_brevis.AAC.1
MKEQGKAQTSKSDGSGGGGGGGGGGGAPGGMGFMPSYVEVKGFCKYEERKEKGATRAQVNQFVSDFKAQLQEDQRSWIGRPQIRAIKSYKFQIT